MGQLETPMLQSQEAGPPLEVIYKKVEADSRFSLHYLKTVDTVITVSNDLRNNASLAEEAFKQFMVRITESGGYEEPFDPEEKLALLSIEAEATVKETLLALQEISGAVAKSSIFSEDAETMSGSIEEAICALQSVHDSMVDLRWAVIEHDADLEKPENRVFHNVEELIADL